MAWTRAEIHDATGFDNGDLFQNEEQVRQYFTPDNIAAMFGECALSAEELHEMAETVIDNGWHMVSLTPLTATQVFAVHWSDLVLLEGDGVTELGVSDEDRRAYLEEFRDTGSINGAFFARLGLPHEDPEDASTWGPLSPDHVDWTGF